MRQGVGFILFQFMDRGYLERLGRHGVYVF